MCFNSKHSIKVFNERLVEVCEDSCVKNVCVWLGDVDDNKGFDLVA